MAAVRTPALSVIVATTPKGGIGKDGTLPWRLPEDMAHFKRVTMSTSDKSRKNAVVMGRKTWESIPEKFRPLPGRINVVLTKAAADSSFKSPYPEDVLVASSVANAVEKLTPREDVEEIFVIGGQAAYEEAVAMPTCERIYLTRVGKDLECDAFFPAFDQSTYIPVHVSKTSSKDGLPYDFVLYQRASGDSKPASLAKSSAPASALVLAGL